MSVNVNTESFYMYSRPFPWKGAERKREEDDRLKMYAYAINAFYDNMAKGEADANIQKPQLISFTCLWLSLP